MPKPTRGLSLPASVVSVHDGDTLTVDITIRANVRLCGDGNDEEKKECWAPELKAPGGLASRENLKRAALGQRGTLVIPIGDANNLSQLFTLGRILGDMWIDGDSMSERQVRTGHASSKKGGKLGE